MPAYSVSQKPDCLHNLIYGHTEVADQTISPSHSIPTPDEPVLELTPKRLALRRIAINLPVFTSLWYDSTAEKKVRVGGGGGGGLRWGGGEEREG